MSSIRHFTFIKDFCVAFLYKIKSKSNLVTPVVVERLKQINLSSVQKSIFRDFVRESTVPEKAFFIKGGYYDRIQMIRHIFQFIGQ